MNQSKQIAEAITTLILSVVTIVNLCLQLKGLPAITIPQEDLSVTINAILAAVFGLYAWWKNNNITKSACIGQEVINALKAGEELEIIQEENENVTDKND